MDKFFKDINNRELTRTNTGFYSLGSTELDRVFGLDQNSIYFIPNSENVECFASITYLYGLMGYTVTNFTAISTGYVATYKKDDDISTLIISNNHEYCREQLFDFAKAQLQTELSAQQQQVFKYIADSVVNPKISLVDICLGCNGLATSDVVLHARLEQAMYPFSGDPESLNSQNCNNNHELLTKLCCSLLGIDYFNATTEQLDQAKQMQQKILDDYIKPSYLTYRGTDRQNNPIPQNSQILQSEQLLTSLTDYLLQGKNIDVATRRRLGIVLNMCSTDFTADMVYNALDIMSHSNDPKKAKEDLRQAIPQTPQNYPSKNNAKQFVNSMLGGTTYAIDVDENLIP